MSVVLDEHFLQREELHAGSSRGLERGQFFPCITMANTHFSHQVLAFEEQPSSKHIGATYGSQKFTRLSPIHSRAQSQPLPFDSKPPPTPPPPSTYSKRTRAPSDPFLDTPAPSRSVATTLSHLSSATTAVGPSEEPSTPTTAFGDDITTPLRLENVDDEDVEEDYMRVWTSPDLTDPEILQLLSLFPSFVSRRALPRFQVNTPRPADIEEGEDADERLRVRFGTGSMWVSSKQRSDGWEGSWWTRFILWWKRLFC